MKIQVVSVGTRMPDWVDTGFLVYQQRLRQPWQLQLIEIPLPKRKLTQTIDQLKAQEAQLILKHIAPGATVIALTVTGKAWSTPELAKVLQRYADNGASLTLIIGGPDGLAAEVLARADGQWSLSNLTLPHGLVRVLVAEAIYRAWSVCHGHPYHRE